jgi:quercetin dioxygenase-like cupin family protein/acyl carrier protein
MSTEILSDGQLTEMLVAVGAEPDLVPASLDTSFDDLELDSLSRAELAARLKSRYGVDVESALTPDTTPNEMRGLLGAALSARGRLRMSVTGTAAGRTLVGGEVTIGAPLAFVRAVLAGRPPRGGGGAEGGPPVVDASPLHVDLRPDAAGGAACRLSAVAPDRTRVSWAPSERPDAPAAWAAALKAGVEESRSRVLSAADVPANRRRGGDVRTLLSPATVGATSGFSGTAVLAPGELVTEHYHPFSEEFIHVVDGLVRIEMADESRTLAAGDAVMVPREVLHRMVNAGGGEARVVFFLSPLAPRPDLGHVDTEVARADA